MDPNPAFLQTRVLKLFGFFPLSLDRKSGGLHGSRCVLQSFLTCLGACLLLGNCACCCLQFVWTVAILLIENGGNFLLKLFVILPLLTDSARPFLVLFIVFTQRRRLQTFYRKIADFVTTAFPDLIVRQRLLRRWRLYSVCLFVVTQTLQQGTFLWSQQVVFSISPSMNFTTDNALSPFQTKLTVWKMSLIWFLFPITNFILSQQVMVLVMVLSLALSESLHSLE
ncbi:hypothetical protein BV898_02789 [Hypsibius exemplaris]|uniref:Uncharacterized protein n=1 Tax=Hypsibius exemplaris TaxID=2072580 RepID=A0A1W0X7Q2_HYPEX|nr:hypothetical protein BV898_02789 [Hypsibius exemplaris]